MYKLAKPLKTVGRSSQMEAARIALVQLDYNPCYKFKIDYVAEPDGLSTSPDTAVTSLRLGDKSLDDVVRSAVADERNKYLEHLRVKLEIIFKALTDAAVDIVCFPEYAIPPELLGDLLPYASRHSLILPSHTATTSSLATLGSLFGDSDLNWSPGHALYVSMPKTTDGQAYLLAKVTRSQFEPSLTPAQETFMLPLLGDESSVLVLMCSDFLQGRDVAVAASRNPAIPLLHQASLRIVCSLTPQTGPFFDIATNDLLRGFSMDRRPTAFVNHAQDGGTCVFALMEQEQILESRDQYCSYRLPGNLEAVAIYDVALGPQVHAKPSPLTPPQQSRLVGLHVLRESDDTPGNLSGSLLDTLNNRRTTAKAVLGHVDAAFDLLSDVTRLETKAKFTPIDLGVPASTVRWRYGAAQRLARSLASVLPSLDTQERQQVDSRIQALERLAGNVSAGTASQAKSPKALKDDTEFITGDGARQGCIGTVLRLARFPRKVPLDHVIGPIWSLVTTVVSDARLALELRYDVMKTSTEDVQQVLTDFGIEMFVSAWFHLDSQEDEPLGRKTLRDIRLLLQMGFGDEYRFAPVSQELWTTYRTAQQMGYAVIAGHEGISGQPRTVTPYSAQPRIDNLLRFLFSRREASSLSFTVRRAELTDIKFLNLAGGSAPQIPHKPEESLSDALRVMDLVRVLRPSPGDPPEEPFCCMRIRLELLDPPTALVPQVVFRELLGDAYATRDEQSTADSPLSADGRSRANSLLEVVSIRECLTLLRFPVGSLPSFGDRTTAKVLQVPIEVAETASGPIIGHAFHEDAPKSIEIRLSDEDRKKHTYVIGKTGTGKTQFLLNLIMQDIEAGNGVCVMDPHGDLFDDVLDRYPKRRARDLVIFDPTDHDNPPGLNLFEHDRSNPMHRDFVVDEAVSIFLRLHGNDMFGPRIQNYFRNAALALMSDPARERTLLDLSRVLLDDEFFRYAMEAGTDPAVADFLAEFRRTAERERAEMIPYFQSKFTPFVSNAGIRNVIGQARSTLNFRQAMDLRRVVLVNLSKGKLGELNSKLLGMMMVSKVTWAALSRAHMAPDQRSDFYLYCDEFQNFATDTFSTVLSEARKYGLCLLLANQYLSQLRISDNFTSFNRDSLKDAVLGNAGNVIVFRVGANDAHNLVNEIAAEGSAKERIESLMATQPRFRAVVRLDCGGRPTHAFTLESQLTNATIDKSRGKALREYVAHQYLLSREFVLADIASARDDFKADGDYLAPSDLAAAKEEPVRE